MAKILKFLFGTDVASDNENYIYHIDASTAGLKFQNNSTCFRVFKLVAK